jgi:hypothetical protein
MSQRPPGTGKARGGSFVSKQLQVVVAVACFLCCTAFLLSVIATHRTGSLIFPELIVAGDFNEDGNLDIAVSAWQPSLGNESNSTTSRSLPLRKKYFVIFLALSS